MPPAQRRGGGGGGSGDWQYGLCGCFGNCYTCICTYFCPCIVAGKVAEKMSQSCCTHGCLTMVPIAGIICRAKIRGMIRDQRGIPGSGCKDVCLHWFCPFCALVQEAREVEVYSKSMAEHPAQELERQ